MAVAFLVKDPNVDNLKDWDNKLHCAIQAKEKIFFIDRKFLNLFLNNTVIVHGGYIRFRGEDNPKDLTFHRWAMGDPKGYVVDHKNRIKEDNRLCNLRIANYCQNNANHTSHNKYVGVRKRGKRYLAEIRYNGKTVNIGTFDTKLEAAIAYDKKKVEIHGEYAKTNFPLSNYDVPKNPLSSELGPTIIVRKKTKCIYCGDFTMSANSVCRKHYSLHKRREVAKGEGREIKEYAPRINKKLEECSIKGCNKRVVCQNLCTTHYREKRILEGKEVRTKPKKRYICSIETCSSPVHKEGLCSAHWKYKNGLSSVWRDDWSQDRNSLVCRIEGCSQNVFSKKFELCKIHYNRWDERSKNYAVNFDDFVSNPDMNGKYFFNSKDKVNNAIMVAKKNQQNKTIKIECEYGRCNIHDQEILFDKCDQRIIQQYKWRFSGNGYLINRTKDKGVVYLWRMVLDDNQSHTVKFKDGNKNNYRKDNLVALNKSQAAGISFKKDAGIKKLAEDKYRVTVYINKKEHYVGTYSTIEDAQEKQQEARERISHMLELNN